MTVIFGAPARAHLYATLTQLLQLPGRPGKASDDAPSSFDAQAEGWDVFDCGLRDGGAPRIELQRLDSPPSGTPLFRSDEDAWHTSLARHAQARSLISRPCKWSIRSNGSPSKRNAAGVRVFSPPRPVDNPTYLERPDDCLFCTICSRHGSRCLGDAA
jgi:hypothetical protein